MAEPMSITAVVVTHNSAALLPDCLRSLAAALHPHPYEVVVADNGSTDSSASSVLDLLPDATVVNLGRNAGYAAGINAGIAAAGPSDAVLVLNPDVRLAAGSVRHLAAGIGIGIGITVPRITGPDGRLELSLRREPTIIRALGEAVLGGPRAGRCRLLGETVSDPNAYDRPQTADWATGAVMLISRACLAAAARAAPEQPWDESFFLYSEETDFALRARDSGFRLRYIPEAGAVHLGGESATSPALWSLLARNRVVLYGRHHRRPAAIAFRAAVVLNEAIRAHRSPTHRAALARLLRPGELVRSPLPASARPEDQPGYICFSAQDFWYHSQAHSDIQLMRRVAEHRPVLFVNSITLRMPLPGRSTRFLRRILRKAMSMARRLRRPLDGLPDFWVFTPVILPLYGIPRVRMVNANFVRWQVARTARRIGIVNPIYVVTIPTAWEVVNKLSRRALIYNRSDKHSTFDEANRAYIEHLEGALLGHADRVLYVSRALMAAESPLVGHRATFLDHGVDLEHFRRRPRHAEPADLRPIARPRIGFFGALDEMVVDFDLLHRLAVEIPDAQLVLVGEASGSMRRFDPLPNVHWLGFKPYEDIPGYGSGFDVALMPWLDNEWISYSNPIKMKEYLALGLPVVTTDFPEAHHYAEVISIAHDVNDFVVRVRTALTEDGDDQARRRRRESVLPESWDRRAQQLVELSESLGRPR